MLVWTVADQHVGVVSRSLYYTLLHVIFTDRVAPFSAVASPEYPATFPSTKTGQSQVGTRQNSRTNLAAKLHCSKELYTHTHAHSSPIHATPYSLPQI